VEQERDPASPNRRQEILEAALIVFAREGFDGASIKRIAAEAGISSPALIYHYFPSKRVLFGAALRNAIPLFDLLDDRTPPDGPPAEVLTRFATLYLQALTRPEMQAVARLVIGEGARDPESVFDLFDGAPLRFVAYLRRYLERQVELGVLKPHDSNAAARAFVGSFVFHGLTTRVLPMLADGAPDDDTLVQQTVATLLHGLATDSPS
jgi:TetR/AcrR family transcriptional regulator